MSNLNNFVKNEFKVYFNENESTYLNLIDDYF